MPLQPAWETAAFPDVLQDAMKRLMAKMEPLNAEHKLDQAAFAINLDTSEVIFTWRDGRKLQARCQVIGASRLENQWDPSFLEFKWAFNDEDLPDDLKRAAIAVRDFGKRRGFSELTAEILNKLHTDRAWCYLAIAAEMTDAAGAIRGPIGDGNEAYLTFGPLRP